MKTKTCLFLSLALGIQIGFSQEAKDIKTLTSKSGTVLGYSKNSGVKIIKENGESFKDLNKNGKLDIYENPTETISNRVEDLISQMTVEEKAGTMFITMTGIRPNGNPYETPFFPMSFKDVMFNRILRPTSDMIVVKKMNSFNIIDSYQPEIMATYNNKIQFKR